jgi:hypothetical protein
VGRIIVTGGRDAVPPVKASDIEFENLPGTETCIFPDTPRDRVPLLDYTKGGVKASLEGSQARMMPGLPNAQFYGLRLHDCEDEARFTAAIAPGGALDGLLEDCRSAGLTTEVGLGMNNPEYILRILREYPRSQELDSVMVCDDLHKTCSKLSTFTTCLLCHSDGWTMESSGPVWIISALRM